MFLPHVSFFFLYFPLPHIPSLYSHLQLLEIVLWRLERRHALFGRNVSVVMPAKRRKEDEGRQKGIQERKEGRKVTMEGRQGRRKKCHIKGKQKAGESDRDCEDREEREQPGGK
jgi:hypothetical protein